MKNFRNFLIIKCMDKVCLNDEILQTEIKKNTTPKRFLKDKIIWAFILLSLKVCIRFLHITYPSSGVKWRSGIEYAMSN